MILDATFTYASAGGKWEGQSTGETWEWDKGTGIEISGRLFYDWKDYVTVVPVFQYGSAEYALQSSPTAFAIPNGDKDMGFLAGVALDLEVNGSNTLIWAAEYVYSKSEPSQPDTVVTTPSGSWKESTMSIFPVFRLALESEITSWLTTRIGAVHANMSFTETYLNGEDKYTDGAYIPGVGWMSNGFEWFLGAGFNVAEWTIDMELAPETPFSMGWWLHGYSAFDSGDDYGPVARISGTYNF
jgi:hypothetical protein